MYRSLLAFMAIASLAQPLLAMEKEEKPLLLLRDMPQEIKNDTQNILTFIHNNPFVVPEEIKNIIKDELISLNRFILIDLFKDSLFKRSRELKGHKGWIRSVAFSPDGKFALTGSYDATARLWNLKDFSSTELKGHAANIKSVAFSPDGKFALTGSDDTTACLWNLQDFSSTELDHMLIIDSAAFSPDGKFALTDSWDDTTACLWKLLPELTLDQVALIAKLDHLTKGNVNPRFLFFENDKTENFYLNVLKSFDQDEQKAIISKFKLDPTVLNVNLITNVHNKSSNSCCLL